MDPVTLAALFGAGVSLGQGAINWFSQNGINEQNYRMHKENLAWSRESQRLAQQYNTQMWQMNNQWNSPANQMALLRGAGLNPNLAYGNAFGNASAPQINSQTASEGHPMQAPQMSGLESIFGNYMQAKQLQQNQQLVDSEVDLNKANADKVRTETKLIPEKHQSDMESAKALRAKLAAETNSEIQNLENLKETHNALAEYTKQAIIKTFVDENSKQDLIRKAKADADFSEKMVEYYGKLIEEIGAKIKLHIAQAGYYNEQRRYQKMYNDWLSKPNLLGADGSILETNAESLWESYSTEIWQRINWAEILNPIYKEFMNLTNSGLSQDQHLAVWRMVLGSFSSAAGGVSSAAMLMKAMPK